MEMQYTPACAPARTTQCQRAASLFIPKPLPPQPAQTNNDKDSNDMEDEQPQDRGVNEEQLSRALSDKSPSHAKNGINMDQQLSTHTANTHAVVMTSVAQEQQSPEPQIQTSISPLEKSEHCKWAWLVE